MTTSYSDYGYGTDKFPEDWKVIAEVDQGEAYEVDQARIYLTPKGVALATASGCSCWDGDWQVDEFDTLHELLAHSLIGEYPFATSWSGAIELFIQANQYFGMEVLA